MDIVKLEGFCKDYVWGGTTLKKWGKKSAGPTVAESWELSLNPDGPSLIASGPESGKPLKDVATKEDIGVLAASFPFFPVLVKLIDSGSDLSVQVHPSDVYALANEGQYGKTEMWRIISCRPGAGVYVGWKRKTDPSEVRRAAADGSLMGLLDFVETKPGDDFFIKSGTVHAIGAGITLIEIQQNSTLTYRLYDYGRLGKDGKPRELHVEKALQVLSYEPYEAPRFVAPLIGECPYFASRLLEVRPDSAVMASLASFKGVTFLSGKGSFAGVPYHRGDTFFVPAGKGGLIKGEGSYVEVETPGPAPR
ncbi:MAG: class I mannose-6-phosphate isomerase [Bacilli bacterium]|jgi:mannose-6-phosphate isomerase|nr:class I mannose-6-phosphate isomerase [Bacilli bacterium]